MAMGGDFLGDLVEAIENQAKIVRAEWIVAGVVAEVDLSNMKAEIEKLRSLCDKAISGSYFKRGKLLK